MTNPATLEYALLYPYDGMIQEQRDFSEAFESLQDALASEALMIDYADYEEAQKYSGVHIVARPIGDPFAEWVEVEED